MAYGIYLKLDQTRAHRDDFSSDAFLTGTIYTNIGESVAKNLTGYTVTIRMHRPIHFGDFFNKEATIVVAANGTWSYLVKSAELPPRGLYYASVELTKAGVKESTLNRVEFHVLGGLT